MTWIINTEGNGETVGDSDKVAALVGSRLSSSLVSIIGKVDSVGKLDSVGKIDAVGNRVKVGIGVAVGISVKVGIGASDFSASAIVLLKITKALDTKSNK